MYGLKSLNKRNDANAKVYIFSETNPQKYKKKLSKRQI